MTRLAGELLRDIEKETVPLAPTTMKPFLFPRFSPPAIRIFW